MRKLLTFLMALGAIVFAVVSPVSANGVLFLAQSSGGGGRTCTDDTASGNFLARTSGLSNTEKDAYCNMIKGLESDGIITGTMNGANSGSGACGALVDAIYIPVTNSTATASLNLCGTSYSLTLTGTCTFTADAGWPCDGTTGFFNTGFVPSTATTPNYSQNSGFICAFIINSRTSSAVQVAIGTVNTSSTVASDIVPLEFSDFAYQINSSTTDFTASSNAKGAYLVNRSASNLVSVYKNGSSTALTTASDASSATMNNAFYISAINNGVGGAANNFRSDTIGAIVIGGGTTPLSNVQAAAIENRINTYLATFGKNAY